MKGMKLVMKEIIYNYDFLSEKDISKVVLRAKALIINNNNILVGNEDGILQFPGGHLEENENFKNCLKREVLEETGIELDDEEISEPFMLVTYLSKDWPESGINQKAIILYFLVETTKEPNLANVNYTEHEKKGKFKIEKIPLEAAIDIIKNNIPNNRKNESIAPEMIAAIEEYMKRFCKYR